MCGGGFQYTDLGGGGAVVVVKWQWHFGTDLRGDVAVNI